MSRADWRKWMTRFNQWTFGSRNCVVWPHLRCRATSYLIPFDFLVVDGSDVL